MLKKIIASEKNKWAGQILDIRSTASLMESIRQQRLDFAVAYTRSQLIELGKTDKSVHFGASLSMANIFTSLYIGGHLNLSSWENRDRLIISNGHAIAGLYPIFHLLGLIEEHELSTFKEGSSRLINHPSKMAGIPAIEASAGSLGQGLGRGIGMALADKIDGKQRFTYITFGDGEFQEGQMHEAMELAPKLGLNNLIAIIDKNRLQLSNPVQRNSSLDLAHLYEMAGWNVICRLCNFFSVKLESIVFMLPERTSFHRVEWVGLARENAELE